MVIKIKSHLPEGQHVYKFVPDYIKKHYGVAATHLSDTSRILNTINHKGIRNDVFHLHGYEDNTLLFRTTYTTSDNTIRGTVDPISFVQRHIEIVLRNKQFVVDEMMIDYEERVKKHIENIEDHDKQLASPFESQDEENLQRYAEARILEESMWNIAATTASTIRNGHIPYASPTSHYLKQATPTDRKTEDRH